MKKVLFALFAVSMLAACQTETAPATEETSTPCCDTTEVVAEPVEGGSEVAKPEVEAVSEESVVK